MSKDKKSFEVDQTVHAEATAWIAQMESGEMSAADRRELTEWMKRSPTHEAVLKEYAQLWLDLDAVALLQPAYDEVIKQRRSTLRVLGSDVSRKPLVAGLAAAAAVCIAVTYVVLPGWLEETKSQQLVVATDVGEAKEVGLVDGSSIDVNTASNVQVNFNKAERAVHLTNGEAVFTVAHDEKRPFVVHAGQHTVRAIGTVFSVRLHDNEIDVIVTEGRVEIAPASLTDNTADVPLAPAAPAAVLVRGQSATATLGGVERVDAVDLTKVEQRLAWRDGMLDFSGETLDYAVGEIMRYTPYEIEIEPGELRLRRVGGVIRIADVGQFLEVLEENFEIDAVETGKDQFLLKSATVN